MSTNRPSETTPADETAYGALRNYLLEFVASTEREYRQFASILFYQGLLQGAANLREAIEVYTRQPRPETTPAALVALVTEWQEAGNEYGSAESPEEQKIAQKRLMRARSELQWWPRHPREDMPDWDKWYPLTPSAAPVAETPTAWQDASSAPADGSAFRAYGPTLVHADFNPWGQVEACYDGERFIGAVWDGQHDCWRTEPIEFTHWQKMPPSPAAAPVVAPQDDRPACPKMPSSVGRLGSRRRSSEMRHLRPPVPETVKTCEWCDGRCTYVCEQKL